MKNVLAYCFVLTGFAFLPVTAAIAQEKMPVDIISHRLEQQGTLASPFYVTVKSSGRLVTHAGRVFTEGLVDPDVKLPSLLTPPESVLYPEAALQQREQGSVVIAIEVRADGSVGETMIMESSGHSSLDEFAEKIVKIWRFHPAMKGDVPIVECIQIPISFQIDNRQ